MIKKSESNNSKTSKGKGFVKVTGHLYMVKNQNGFNNALYDYFEATDNGENYTKSKKRCKRNGTKYSTILSNLFCNSGFNFRM